MSGSVSVFDQRPAARVLGSRERERSAYARHSRSRPTLSRAPRNSHEYAHALAHAGRVSAAPKADSWLLLLRLRRRWFTVWRRLGWLEFPGKRRGLGRFAQPQRLEAYPLVGIWLLSGLQE